MLILDTDDLYLKRKDLQMAEDKLLQLEETASAVGPALLRRSSSTTDVHSNELQKVIMSPPLPSLTLFSCKKRTKYCVPQWTGKHGK